MISSKIAYNTFISAGARIVGLAISLTTIGFVTRYLGQDGFGQYATILAFLYIFSILADLGLYLISLREISRPGADEKKIISNAFTLRFTAGLVVFALAPLISLLMPYPSQFKTGVLIGAVGFWAMSNYQLLIGVFQKYLQMTKVALGELLGRIAQIALVVFFVWQDAGFLAIVGALTGGALTSYFVIFYSAKKYVDFSFRFDFSFWKSFLKKSFPLAVAAVLTMVYFRIDTIMLSLMKGAADTGVYGLAYKILESLLFFPAMFVGLVMPLLSKYAFSDRKEFINIFQNTLNVLLIIIIPMIVAVFFLSPEIISLIAGSEFLPSAGVLNILIIATAIIFLAILFQNMIISLEKQKSLTYIYGIGAIINLGANFYFIPKYSYSGAAATTVLTEAIVTLLMVALLYRLLGRLPLSFSLFKYLLAGLVMALVFYFLSPLNWIVLAFLAAMAYFVFLYLIGGISNKQILSLVKRQ